MPNNDSHQHVVKTSAQWNDRAVEYWVVPRGCLCVELTSRGKTKLKVGEGNKYYAQLPYICDIEDLSDYYTKEEINNLFNNLNRMAIMSTEEYDEKSDLPLTGNKLGDVRFVKSSSPSLKLDPDVYLWNGHKWIFVGYDIIDIDLSQYIKREEFEPVAAKVDEMYPKMHTHENKETLDRIEEPYTTAEKDKLDSLENYDDTEIRALIRQATHVHPNKSILDQIQQPFKNTDKEKLDSLENYDDTELRDRISDVEAVAHTHSNKDELDSIYSGFVDEHQVLVEFKTVAEEEIDDLNNDVADLKTKIHIHSNKNILDSTTAPYTTQDKATLDELAAITIFDGASPTYDGFRGYVPAPLAGDENKFLRGDGTWQTVSGGTQYQAGAGIGIQQGVSESYHIVEYLESKLSDRSQAIDTGYKKTQNLGMLNIQLKWRLIDEPTASANVVTSHEPDAAPVTGCIAISARKGTSMSYFAPCAVIFTSDGWNGSTNFQYDPNNHDATILRTDVCGWDDDGDISLNAESGPYHTDASVVWKNIFLFDNVPARIYFCRIFDNDTLVRDLVPCVRDSDNIQGFYDKVEKVFYPNPFDQPTSTDYISGPETGEVVYDFTHESESDPYIITNKGIIDADYDSQNLELTLTKDDSSLTIPVGDTVYTAGENIIITGEREEFTKLEYIQGKGNQNINTHKRIRSGHGKFAVDFQFVHQPESEKNRRYEFIIATKYVGNEMPVGSPIIGFARTDSGGSYGTMGGIVNGTNSFWWYWINSSSTTDRTNVNVEYFPDTKIGINGAVYSPDNWPVINDGELYLFGTSDYKCWAKLYSVKIWDDDVLIFDGIPVKRNSDNEVGIFDKCNNEFFINDLGGGALGFKAGPVESGADPVYGNYVGRTKTISAVSYTLPIASDDTLGGVKVGSGLEINEDGVLSASGDNDYTAGEGIDITGATRPIDINYIRLDINNSRDNGRGHIIQFKNIRVLDTNSNSLQFSHASSVYGDGSIVEYGQNSRDESPQAMIEGRNKTCCTNFSLSKAPLKITFTLTSEISIANITSFSILTGADYPTRDPVSWDIYASNDGVTWYKIQEAHSPDVTTTRSTWITNIPFVIPPDAVEVLPGVKTIKAKIGTGLTFDSNDAIELDDSIKLRLNCNNEPN